MAESPQKKDAQAGKRYAEMTAVSPAAKKRRPWTAVDIVTLLVTLGFACLFFADRQRILVLASLMAILVLSMLLRKAGQIGAFALFLFYALALAYRLLPGPKYWPLFYLVPLVSWSVLIALTGTWRDIRAAFRLGSRNRTTLILAVVSVVGSGAVLEVWARSHEVYLHAQAGHVPPLQPSLLYLAGIIFAAVNAIMEELIFRGIIHGGLRQILARPGLVVPLQALVFGAAHISGVPGGLSGVLLATVYGLFLGWIREASEGLLWPVVTHVFADAIIFILLIHAR